MVVDHFKEQLLLKRWESAFLPHITNQNFMHNIPTRGNKNVNSTNFCILIGVQVA
jgi:hypothetical protein